METEPHRDEDVEGWTPELLTWLLAWIDLVMELPKNREIIEKIKSLD